MVDFGKMLNDMNKDKERRAAMTPEARKAEDAAKDKERQDRLAVVEDRELFEGRKIRALSADLTGDQRRLPNGDIQLSAQNAQGPLKVIIPGMRSDRFSESPAREALNAAFMASENPRDGTAKVPVQGEGFFRPRNWKDSAGKPMQSWDFVASKVSFEHEGKTHTVGYDVAPPKAKEQAKAVEQQKSRSSGGDAR